MLWYTLLLLHGVVGFVFAETKQFTTTDGLSYTYDYVPANDSQPTILFLHGFPSGRHHWRNQVDHVTAAGFGAIVPDCLGYGDSDAPLNVDAYRLKTLAGHVVAILDQEGLDSVVGVAHDWGVTVLSHTWVYHPERFSKLAFLSVGYNPPGPFDLDAFNAQSLQQFGYTQLGYWYFFNAFDAADVLSENVESFFSLAFPFQPSIWRDNLGMLGGARAWLTANTTTAMPSYMTEQTKQDWLQRFSSRDAITSSLNYYRSILQGVQVEDAAELVAEDLLIDAPVLTIVGGQDAITSPDQVEGLTRAWVRKSYSPEVVQGGHWPMLEQPAEVNALLTRFASAN